MSIFPLHYGGVTYDDFPALWRAHGGTSAVSANTVRVRLETRLLHEAFTDARITECLTLEVDEYRVRFGRRRTWIETVNGTLDCRDLYDVTKPEVDYAAFRTRLRSLEHRGIPITDEIVAEAARLDQSKWRTAYGGGRRRAVSYRGNLHPEARGDYLSVASFLKEIGRYDDRNLINNRLRRRWEIDDALREPVQQLGQPGYIYLITEDVTERCYVGLSINTPLVRFGQHRRSATEGSETFLHRAMRQHSLDVFHVETIEIVEAGDDLGLRERYWIAELGTLYPDGYNMREGGQTGGYDGVPTTWDRKDYPSIAAMCRGVSRETGLAEHVIESRYRQGLPLPEQARTHSDHPEAGSPLFRQWLGMKKRATESGAGMDDNWLDYDAWKVDVVLIPGDGRLTRIDETRPWGPGNCIRIDHREIVRRTHGQTFSALGRTWKTKQEALDEHDVPRNTFDLRVKSGMSIDEALTRPLGPTSKMAITVDGEDFESRNQACIALSARYSMSADQVKDYLVRDVPTSEWPKHGAHVRSGPGVPVAYEVDEVHYASEKEMCRAFGLPVGTFQKRRRNGMSVRDALKMPVRDARIVLFGYDWPSAKAACKAFGLPHSTYRARTGDLGMNPEEALMAPTSRGYAGIGEKDVAALCEAYGLAKPDA